MSASQYSSVTSFNIVISSLFLSQTNTFLSISGCLSCYWTLSVFHSSGLSGMHAWQKRLRSEMLWLRVFTIFLSAVTNAAFWWWPCDNVWILLSLSMCQGSVLMWHLRWRCVVLLLEHAGCLSVRQRWEPFVYVYRLHVLITSSLSVWKYLRLLFHCGRYDHDLLCAFYPLITVSLLKFNM